MSVHTNKNLYSLASKRLAKWLEEMEEELAAKKEREKHWVGLTKEERYDCVNDHIGLLRSDDPQLHDAVYSIVDEVEKKLKEKNTHERI